MFESSSKSARRTMRRCTAMPLAEGPQVTAISPEAGPTIAGAPPGGDSQISSASPQGGATVALFLPEAGQDETAVPPEGGPTVIAAAPHEPDEGTTTGSPDAGQAITGPENRSDNRGMMMMQTRIGLLTKTLNR